MKCVCTKLACTVCTSGVVRNPIGVIDVRSVEYPGINQLTCEQLESFADLGTIPENSCPTLQEAAVDVCDCRVNPCSICPVGTMTKPNATINVTSMGISKTDSLTCKELMAIGNEGLLSGDQCVALQGSALEVCGCDD